MPSGRALRRRNNIVTIRDEQVPESSLYRSLVRWAKTRPGATYIVEAETGRELTYAHTLAAVNEMRQLLGNTPRCLLLAFPSRTPNTLWLTSAPTGAHQLLPLP